MITPKHTDLIAFIVKLKIQDLDEIMKSDIVKHDLTLQLHYSEQRRLLKEYYMAIRTKNSCLCAMKVKAPKAFSFYPLWNKLKRFLS